MQIHQVSKRYGKNTVVSDVNYRVKKGKLTALIGPNGAGKSTLLYMMSRMIKTDEGNIYLDGLKIKTWNNQELAKKLSILKQTNAIQLKLTVRELVSFGRFPYTKGRLTEADEEEITKSLKFLGLSDLTQENVTSLSGGQLQRVYIAMVLAQDTEYIFLDEPLNNLDMKHAVQFMKNIRKLVDEKGKTIVIVIHDINFASSYADEIVAMKDGKIFKAGSTKEIVDRRVLEKLYDMSIRIYDNEGKKFCLYFNE